MPMLHFVASFLDLTLRHFRFVKKLNDRDGYFRQIRESMTTLASEISVTKCHAEPDNESADDESGDIVSLLLRTEKLAPLTGSRLLHQTTVLG